jgi:DeoR/GlpR family transcriptional regulator of sugar metabolism
MSVSSQDRQRRIISEVISRKHVTARDIAIEMAVSEATVRRDFKVLANSGQVELVYGGATIARNADYSFGSKASRNVEAKRTIAALAAAFIHDGDQILLDSGTTCFGVADHLKQKHDLSVIVNSAPLAMKLGSPGISVIVLGGQYRPERMDAIGPLCTSQLDQLRGYVALIGADGVSKDFGPAASDIESAHLYRLAVRNARETFLLVDHSKFAAPSLFKIVDWNSISRVVTDTAPSADWMEFFQSQGIKMAYPGQDNGGPPPSESRTE